MHVEARMPGKPFLYGGVFVRGVIVGNQMQRLVLRRTAVNLAQELQPFGVGVALLALADDLAIQHIECGNKRGRAIALVVIRHYRRAPLLQR